MMYDDRYGTVSGMQIGGGTEMLGNNLPPVPLCPRQIPHDLGFKLDQHGEKQVVAGLSNITAIYNPCRSRGLVYTKLIHLSKVILD
jgi:hypothetical protein